MNKNEFKKFRIAVIEKFLSGLPEKDKIPFGQGDIVTTLEGPFAHRGLMFMERLGGGVARVSPAHLAPCIEIPEAKLFSFRDYHLAFKVSLIKIQGSNFALPN